MNTRIRLARTADLAHLQLVEEASDSLFIERFGATSWPPAANGPQRAAEAGFILVAVGDDAVLGFAHVLEVDGFAHLEQLSVLPEHGRRGIGTRLVEAALDEARQRGYRDVTLRTYRDVPWNGPWYRRLGFVEMAPASDFHRRLTETEKQLGLERFGPRVQMTATLANS